MLMNARSAADTSMGSNPRAHTHRPAGSDFLRGGVKDEGGAPCWSVFSNPTRMPKKKVTGAHLQISRATRATPASRAILTVRFDGILPLGFGATQYFSQALQNATSALFFSVATRAYRPATARGERCTRVLPRCACAGSVPLLLRRRCHSRKRTMTASKLRQHT